MDTITMFLIWGKQEGKGKRKKLNMFSAVQCSCVCLDLWLKQTSPVSTAGRCGIPDSLQTCLL